MFPLDHRGEFSRSKATIPDVIYFRTDFFVRTDRALKAVRAQNITVTDGRIAFTGGMFRLTWNWNILNPVGYGYIELREHEESFVVCYYASFRQMFVCVVVALVFFGFILFSGRSDDFSVAEKLILLLFAWVFLFGGNWVIAMIQLPSFVKSMLWGGERI